MKDVTLRRTNAFRVRLLLLATIGLLCIVAGLPDNAAAQELQRRPPPTPGPMLA